MGIFANSDPGVGTLVGPGVETSGTSGFDAFGKPVSFSRRQAGMDHCRAMGISDTETAMTLVDKMANHIERDRPHEAMEFANKYLDPTGVYRLLAVLCTDARKD